MTPSRSEWVLQCATRVFLAHGYSAATTDMIQSEAGVSKATVYAHYPNKERLFEAVVRGACERLTASVRAIAPSDGPVDVKLQEIGRAYLGLLLSAEGLALFRVVVAEAPRFPGLGREFFIAGPLVIQQEVASHLQAAADAGTLNLQSVGVDAAANLFLSLLRGDGQLQCLTHPGAVASAAQIDDWTRLAVRVFMDAFGC